MPSQDNWTDGTVSSSAIHPHHDPVPAAMSAKQQHHVPHSHQSVGHSAPSTQSSTHLASKRRASNALITSSSNSAGAPTANGSLASGSGSGSSGTAGGAGSTSAAAGSTSSNGGQSSTTPSKKVSHVPCKFYRQSMCQAGDKCPFSHDLDTERPAVCKYFEKGNCKFGSKCALAHIGPDGRQINKRSPKSGRDALKSPRNGASTRTAPTTASKEHLQEEKRPSLAFTRLHQEPADFEPGAGSHLNPTQTYAQAVQSPIPHEKPALQQRLTSLTTSLSQPQPPSQQQQQHQQSPQQPSQTGPNGSGALGHPIGQPIGQPPLGSIGAIGSIGSIGSLGQPLASPLIEPDRRGSRGSMSGSQSQSRVGSIFDFGSQNSNGRSNSMSLPGSTSIWQDRLTLAQQQHLRSRAIEGSAIADDDDSDVLVETDEGFEEGLVPSALSDLLTPQERDRRNSRNSRESRGSFSSLGLASPGQPPASSLASAQFQPKSRALSSPINTHAVLAPAPPGAGSVPGPGPGPHMHQPVQPALQPLPSSAQAPSTNAADPWSWYQRPPNTSAQVPSSGAPVAIASQNVARSPIGYPFTPVRRSSRPSGSALVGSPPSLYGFGLSAPQPGLQSQPIPTPPSSAPHGNGNDFKLSHEPRSQPPTAATTAENAF